jgi:hypothetical protein
MEDKVPPMARDMITIPMSLLFFMDMEWEWITIPSKGNIASQTLHLPFVTYWEFPTLLDALEKL